jgi:hypothetical protein
MYKPFLFFCLVLISLSIFAQEDWKLKKDTDSIKIFTRSLPNASLDEFKAETTINASIDDILFQLLTAPEYYESCEPDISYYVKMQSKNQHIFYAYKSLPWPIKDRDLITLLTVKKISDTQIKLVLESLPDVLPEKKKTIRIKELMGHWVLEEKHGKTKVTQQLFVNPEGSLPSFVINLLLIKGPLKTFSELRNSINTSNVLVSEK